MPYGAWCWTLWHAAWRLCPSSSSPLILLGLLYYAYKIAPGRMGGGPGRPRTKVKPSAKTMSKVAGIRKTTGSPGKRKSYPFQVIEGSKGKNDDQLPKYH
ncbi:hypothetical protein ACFTAO_31080 [Paenibacillus rhizoplanae]